MTIDRRDEHDGRIDRLERALDAVLRRLDALEESRGVERCPPESAPVAPPPPAAHPPVAYSPAEAMGIAAPSVRADSAHALTPKVPHSQITPPARIPVAPRTHGGAELAIGMRVSAWIGAAIVFIGAALLVHLGITSGWWGGLSGTARTLLIASAGAALLIGGEVVLRRIGRTPSVGLFGAGLAIVHLDVWAAHRFFGVLSESAAFPAFVLSVGLAFLITLRTRMLAIGVLALIAAYGVPLLVRPEAGSGTGPDIILALYLSLVLGSALALSAVNPQTFRALRMVAICGLVVPGFVWILTSGSDPAVAATATGIWWGLVVAESVIAAIRRQSPALNVLATLLATGCFVTGGVFVLSTGMGAGIRWNGLYTMLPAVLAATVAWQMAGLEGLTRRPEHAVTKLACALHWQAAAMMLAAVAMLARPEVMSLAWALLGCAAIESGRRIGSRLLLVVGLGGLALATGRAMIFDRFVPPMHQPLMHLGSFGSVTGWMILMVFLIAAWLLASLRWPAQPQVTPVSTDDVEDPPDPGAVSCSWAAALTGAVLIISESPSAPRSAASFFVLGMVFVLIRRRVATSAARAVAVTLCTIGACIAILHPDRLPLALGAPAQVTHAGIAMIWFIAAALNGTGLLVALGTPPCTLRGIVRRSSTGGPLLLAILVLAAIPEIAAYLPGESALTRPAHAELALRSVFILAAAACAAAWIGRHRRHEAMAQAGFTSALMSAAVFMVPGAIVAFLAGSAGARPPLLHLEFAGALAALAALAAAMRWGAGPFVRPACAAAACAIVLLEGTLELDRLLHDQHAVRNAALSVYWGLFGFTLIAAGLIKRVPPARYAGLVMLLIVTAKVLFYDLAALQGVPRVISFFAAGGVLLVTSITYGRLTAAVTQRESRPSP